MRRVSLLSDELGYDISAPRLVGDARLLEVKATTVDMDPIRIHLSRNEARVGDAYPHWSLVICTVTDVAVRTGKIAGWCHAASLEKRLPADGEGGRWESAKLGVPLIDLMPNMPPAAL